MARNIPVKHTPVEETAIAASVRAENAQREVEDTTDYGKSVVGGIREHYSLQEELALHRKAIRHLIAKYGAENDEELAEFIVYDNVAEQVKAEIKEKELH